MMMLMMLILTMLMMIVTMMMMFFWAVGQSRARGTASLSVSCSLDAERIALVKLLCGAITLPNRARSGAPEVTTSLLVATASQ